MPEPEPETYTVVIGEQDWLPIYDFGFAGRSDDPFPIAAQYGRAVVRWTQKSGFFIDDLHFMSCLHGQQPSEARIDMGLWTRSGAFNIDSVRYARRRLRELGLPDGLATDAQLQHPEHCWRVRTYVTDYFSYFDKRDVTVWRCPPIEAGGWRFSPGEIWGFLKVARRAESQPAGTLLHALSTNHLAEGSQLTEVLLSVVGRVRDSNLCRPRFFDEDWDHCFGFDADIDAGSSGGAVLRRDDLTVVGVISSDVYWPKWLSQRRPWMYGWGVGTWAGIGFTTFAKNYAAYIPPLEDIPRLSIEATRLPANRDTGSTRWAGGYGGTPISGRCPDDYLAVGIVGTTADDTPRRFDRVQPYDSRVGNFGIVCAPFTGADRSVRDSSNRPLAAMVTIVAGSQNTDFVRTAPGQHFDLNAYLNEVVVGGPNSVLELEALQQTMQLCPPGRYLSGLDVRTDGHYVNAIEALQCTHGQGTNRYPLHEPLGTRAAGATVELRCGDVVDGAGTREAVEGLRARSGWLLDGVSLDCTSF